MKETHYIAVTADPSKRLSIHGIGSTSELAIIAAVKAADAQFDIFVGHPCTKELHDYVKSLGSPNTWDYVDGVAHFVIDPFAVKMVVDHCIASIERNWQLRGGAIDEWTGDEAIEIYVEEMETGGKQDELIRIVSHPGQRAAAARSIDNWVKGYEYANWAVA